MRGTNRDRRVARKRKPDEREIRRAKTNFNIAIPELALFVEKHVVRRNVHTRLGGRTEQFRMIEAGGPKRSRWLIGLLCRGKARQPFAIEIRKRSAPAESRRASAQP